MCLVLVVEVGARRRRAHLSDLGQAKGKDVEPKEVEGQGGQREAWRSDLKENREGLQRQPREEEQSQPREGMEVAREGRMHQGSGAPSLL